jgi:hypothetical protein
MRQCRDIGNQCCNNYYYKSHWNSLLPIHE